MVRKPQTTDSAVKRIDSLSLSSNALGILVKAFTEKGNRIQFSAKGNSMFPIIRDGDSVTVSPYAETSPESGDIVAYIDDRTENLIIHRIMDLSADGFTAKGDSCFRKDLRQPIENIIGYVSTINNRNDGVWGINHRKSKKYFTLFSRFGLIHFWGKALKICHIPNFRA